MENDPENRLRFVLLSVLFSRVAAGKAARRRRNGRILVHTGAIRAPNPREITMADKSPKKSTSKTAASKSLKEKRADKKSKAASKSNG